MVFDQWWSVALVGMLGGIASHLIIYLDMSRRPKVEWPEFIANEKLHVFYYLIIMANLMVASAITLVILGYNHVEGYKAVVVGFGWPTILQWGLEKLAPSKKAKSKKNHKP